MSSYIINAKNTSGDEGTISADVGFNYSDKLNSMNEANIKISGSSETKRGLIEVGSEFKIYRDGTLEFYGVADLIDFLEGGGLSVHCTGYEVWLAKENGDYASSPWSATASATIFSAIITESNYLTGGTVEAGTNIDFRLQEADSLWNALSNLKEKTQQDIGIDYANKEVDILDHKGSSTSVETFNAGIQIANLAVTQAYPQGNDIRVYGKSEGETRIKSDHASYGQDATSKANYGTIRKIHRDPSILTQGEANILADALVAIYKDPVKVYDFEVLNPSKDLVSGDVLTLNAKSQGLNNEEVRIVSLERGIKGGGEYLTLQVTNKEYSRAIKNRNEIIAGIEKNNRDQQTYDAFQDEYSNQNVTTDIAGFDATIGNWFDIGTSDFMTTGIGSFGTLNVNCSSIYSTIDEELSLSGNKIISLLDPTANQDAATKYYVDNAGGSSLFDKSVVNNWYKIHDANYSLVPNATASGAGYNMLGGTGANEKWMNLYVYGVYSNLISMAGNINMNNYDIDNCDDIEVNDIYNNSSSDIDLEDDLEVDYGEVISADSYNLNLTGGTDAVVIGLMSIGGSYDDLVVVDDLDVFGTLSKSSGSFKIDHPLDPENKFLYHSFVESPEMRNIYYGQVNILNKKAAVSLPKWWHALNGKDKREFNYQLTPIGKKANCWISKEIENGKFEISSDIDCKISWQVSGIRHDKFAEENRVEVEVDKNKEIENRFPELSRLSDKYSYDKDLDVPYKKSKEAMFLEKKPDYIQMNIEKEKKNQLKESLKNLRGNLKKETKENKIKEIRENIAVDKKEKRKARDKIKSLKEIMIKIDEKYKNKKWKG